MWGKRWCGRNGKHLRRGSSGESGNVWLEDGQVDGGVEFELVLEGRALPCGSGEEGLW